jgi:CBS domain-containing protein
MGVEMDFVAESYSENSTLNNSVAKSEGFIQCNTGFFLPHTLHSVIRLTKTTKLNSPTGRPKMKVSEILQVKGNILYTITPDQPLVEAAKTMAEKDIGSLVVMEFGDLVGMLTFREVLKALHENDGSVGGGTVRKHMEDHPITVTPDTEVNEVRRIMLEKHARYLPVMNAKTLLGVISFYDVARAVLEAQSFENRMLKAYIRDWPAEQEQPAD